MIKQGHTIPPVSLRSPEPQELCEALFFALMLSSLRKRFPRVHYTFPQFATFCRGEALEGPALQELDEELEQIITGLAELGHMELFVLAAGEDASDPDIYRQAHYRGRTFDRNRVEPSQELPARTPSEVYLPLLRVIQEAALKAKENKSALAQEKRSYHQNLEPTGS